MRKTFLVLLMLTVGYALAQNQGSETIGDPFFPGLGNGGYDALHYTLDLDTDLNTIDGSVTIEAQATEDLSAFNLDFVGFKIGKLTVDGEEAAFSREERELTITPAQPLTSGSMFTVVVDYAGTPNASDIGNFANGWTRYSRGVFVASEPAGAAQWFPVNDHPLDKATYTVMVTVPTPYVVASNGFLEEVIETDETITYRWENREPTVSYLVTVNIAQFEERTDTTASGLPIRNYFPTKLADEGERVFAPQADMIEYFETLFGSYPFEVYGVVVADANLPFALETQTLSLFGRDVITHDTGRRTPDGSEGVIAHELAHQWFGNSVSLTTWQDLWLNEGFASYAQILWIERKLGVEVRDEVLAEWYGVVSNRALVLRGIATPGSPPQGDPDDIEALFNPSVYLRGAWTLHALRLEIGDEAFFETLRTYTQTYADSNATTADFIALAESVSGQELSALFQTWLYEEKIPPVELDEAK